MIVRGPRPSDRFAIIANAAVEDARLSLKARGLLAYLLSRPPGWQTSADRLAVTVSEKDKRDAIKTALRELEALGYLRRSKSQDKAGRWTWVQEITDQPEDGKPADLLPTEAHTSAGSPEPEPQVSAEVASQISGKPADPVVDGSSVDGKSTDGSSTGGSSVAISKTDHQEGSTKTPSSSSISTPSRLEWYPSKEIAAQAVAEYPKATARAVTLDYIAWTKKKGVPRDDSGWLGFMKREHERILRIEREEAEAKAAPRRWYGVAGDE